MKRLDGFKFYGAIALIAFSVFALAGKACGAGQILTGRIVDVSDGDTLAVKIDHHDYIAAVRLYGVDAPELDQAHGEESKASLEKWRGYPVKLEVRGNSFHRLVCKTWGEGKPGGWTDLGSYTLSRGLGWHDARYTTKAVGAAYDATQAKARTRRVGLWADADPVPPWKWRDIPKAEREAIAIHPPHDERPDLNHYERKAPLFGGAIILPASFIPPAMEKDIRTPPACCACCGPACSCDPCQCDRR